MRDQGRNKVLKKVEGIRCEVQVIWSLLGHNVVLLFNQKEIKRVQMQERLFGGEKIRSSHPMAANLFNDHESSEKGGYGRVEACKEKCHKIALEKARKASCLVGSS